MYLCVSDVVMVIFITGFLLREKLSQISRFCGDFRKFSPWKSISKQLDTVLMGVVHWVTANSGMFSPQKFST